MTLQTEPLNFKQGSAFFLCGRFPAFCGKVIRMLLLTLWLISSHSEPGIRILPLVWFQTSWESLRLSYVHLQCLVFHLLMSRTGYPNASAQCGFGCHGIAELGTHPYRAKGADPSGLFRMVWMGLRSRMGFLLRQGSISSNWSSTHGRGSDNWLGRVLEGKKRSTDLSGITTDNSKQTVFVACYMFDLSIYFPKFSLVAFFWWLIPHGFRSHRIGVYMSTAFVACAFVATLLVDTLIAGKVSNNW